jgi:hypothetical protein
LRIRSDTGAEKVLGQIIDTSNFSVHDDLDEDVGDNGSAVPAALGARTSRVLREEHADLLLQDSRGRAVGTTSGTLCEIAASAACCGAEDEIARAARVVGLFSSCVRVQARAFRCRTQHLCARDRPEEVPPMACRGSFYDGCKHFALDRGECGPYREAV